MLQKSSADSVSLGAQAGPLDEVGEFTDWDVVGQRFHAKVTIGREQNDFADKMTNLAWEQKKKRKSHWRSFSMSRENRLNKPRFSSTFFLHRLSAVSRIRSSFDLCSLEPSSVVKITELTMEPFVVTHLQEGKSMLRVDWKASGREFLTSQPDSSTWGTPGRPSRPEQRTLRVSDRSDCRCAATMLAQSAAVDLAARLPQFQLMSMA